jgi:hypothetical protein
VKALSNDWNANEIVRLLEGGNKRFAGHIASKKKKYLKRDGILCTMIGAHHESIAKAFNDEFDRCYGTRAALVYMKALSKRAQDAMDSYNTRLTGTLHSK